jgi:hypothetical protein
VSHAAEGSPPTTRFDAGRDAGLLGRNGRLPAVPHRPPRRDPMCRAEVSDASTQSPLDPVPAQISVRRIVEQSPGDSRTPGQEWAV